MRESEKIKKGYYKEEIERDRDRHAHMENEIHYKTQNNLGNTQRERLDKGIGGHIFLFGLHLPQRKTLQIWG